METSALLPNKTCRDCLAQLMDFIPFMQLCMESIRQWNDISIYLNDFIVPKKTRSLYIIAGKSVQTYACPKSTKSVKDSVRNLKNKFNGRKNGGIDLKKSGKRMNCPECHSSFSNVVKFNTHIKNIGKKMCVHCNLIIDLDVYGNHLKTHQLSIYPCNFCPEVFRRDSSLTIHMSKHRENHICFECKQAFRTSTNLAAHCVKHKSVVCSGCSRKFSNKICYLRHGRSCVNIKEKSTKYVCDYCSKEYRMRNGLKLHIILSHMAGKQYQCDQCGKKFLSRVHLEEHGNTHNKIIDRYTCVTCGAKFSTRRGHERHVQKHQIGLDGIKISKYQCPICKKIYLQRKSIDNHLKIKHGVASITVI